MSGAAGLPLRLAPSPGLLPALCVEFRRRADRYEHRVLVCLPDGELEVLRSCEGDNDQEWPASPPLQQLSIESRQEGPVALGLGMSGKSHWSASVELLSAPWRARFELACVPRPTRGALGSLYHLSRGQLDATPDGLQVVDNAFRLLLRTEQLPHDLATGWTLVEQGVLIQPQAGGNWGPNVRWRYEVELLGDERLP